MMRMMQVKRIWSWGRAGGDRDTRLLCGATWASGELLLYLFVLRKLYSGGNGLDWTGLIRRCWWERKARVYRGSFINFNRQAEWQTR